MLIYIFVLRWICSSYATTCGIGGNLMTVRQLIPVVGGMRHDVRVSCIVSLNSLLHLVIGQGLVLSRL